MVFFVVGTSATKVKKEVKATLTLSSTGTRNSHNGSVVPEILSGGWNKTTEYQEKREAAKRTSTGGAAGGQEPRSAVQVIANSGCVSLLCLMQVAIYGLNNKGTDGYVDRSSGCFGSVPARDMILAGTIANYAAVTADTLSSEFGILSSHKPRFILSLKEVPPGTNGGVTVTGLVAGLGGALIIGLVSFLLLPAQCEATLGHKFGLVLATGAWGALGSVLDSILGAVLQATVVDTRRGLVVEAPYGGRVLVAAKKEKDEKAEGTPSRIVGSGRDLLDNNQVNFVMAATMTVGAMVLAGRAWDVSLSALWTKM